MLAGTPMMAYSMSKAITAAAVLHLVEAGKIGLDTSIAHYLDWQPYGGGISVRQALSHTSGIPNPLPLRWVHPVSRHAAFDERAAVDALLRKHPRLAFAPGSRYAYSNIAYWLLGGIVERAGGQPFSSYVTQSVLRPLGIELGEIDYSMRGPATQAAGYLQSFSLMNLLKPWLIDRDLIGGSAGRWLRIRDHYPNGPAFGGLTGSALGFSKCLQDQLRARSQEAARSL